MAASTKKIGPHNFVLVNLRHGNAHLEEMPDEYAIVWECSRSDCGEIRDLTSEEFELYYNDKLTTD